VGNRLSKIYTRTGDDGGVIVGRIAGVLPAKLRAHRKAWFSPGFVAHVWRRAHAGASMRLGSCNHGGSNIRG
jgi:hypothetical protein